MQKFSNLSLFPKGVILPFSELVVEAQNSIKNFKEI